VFRHEFFPRRVQSCPFEFRVQKACDPDQFSVVKWQQPSGDRFESGAATFCVIANHPRAIRRGPLHRFNADLLHTWGDRRCGHVPIRTRKGGGDAKKARGA
jgi:hypothetical protein